MRLLIYFIRKMGISKFMPKIKQLFKILETLVNFCNYMRVFFDTCKKRVVFSFQILKI